MPDKPVDKTKRIVEVPKAVSSAELRKMAEEAKKSREEGSK